MRPEPTRDEVRKVLEDLAAGTLTPAEADDWARPWITEEAGDVQDELVWDTIGWLFGADSMVGPDEYLYGPLDFQAWLDAFDARSKGG
ncbi:hypothetical protein AB0M83_04920 [Amycolatopsis sp. NPDC051106]|uniref:hypothetical protein n=1 Tax=unclassified Amycolatopsis TaxID=2618356 RepID=UPI003424C6C7